MLRQTSRPCNAPFRRRRIEKWPNLRKASVQVCFIKSSIAPTHGFAIHSQSLLMTTPSPPSAANRSADDPLTLMTAENDPDHRCVSPGPLSHSHLVRYSVGPTEPLSQPPDTPLTCAEGHESSPSTSRYSGACAHACFECQTDRDRYTLHDTTLTDLNHSNMNSNLTSSTMLPLSPNQSPSMLFDFSLATEPSDDLSRLGEPNIVHGGTTGLLDTADDLPPQGDEVPLDPTYPVIDSYQKLLLSTLQHQKELAKKVGNALQATSKHRAPTGADEPVMSVRVAPGLPPPLRRQLNFFLHNSEEAPREVVTSVRPITAFPLDPQTELRTESDGKGGWRLQESVMERQRRQAEEKRKQWKKAGFSFYKGLGFVDTSEDEEESPEHARATLSPKVQQADDLSPHSVSNPLNLPGEGYPTLYDLKATPEERLSPASDDPMEIEQLEVALPAVGAPEPSHGFEVEVDPTPTTREALNDDILAAPATSGATSGPSKLFGFSALGPELEVVEGMVRRLLDAHQLRANPTGYLGGILSALDPQLQQPIDFLKAKVAPLIKTVHGINLQAGTTFAPGALRLPELDQNVQALVDVVDRARFYNLEGHPIRELKINGFLPRDGLVGMEASMYVEIVYTFYLHLQEAVSVVNEADDLLKETSGNVHNTSKMIAAGRRLDAVSLRHTMESEEYLGAKVAAEIYKGIYGEVGELCLKLGNQELKDNMVKMGCRLADVAATFGQKLKSLEEEHAAALEVLLRPGAGGPTARQETVLHQIFCDVVLALLERADRLRLAIVWAEACRAAVQLEKPLHLTALDYLLARFPGHNEETRLAVESTLQAEPLTTFSADGSDADYPAGGKIGYKLARLEACASGVAAPPPTPCEFAEEVATYLLIDAAAAAEEAQWLRELEHMRYQLDEAILAASSTEPSSFQSQLGEAFAAADARHAAYSDGQPASRYWGDEDDDGVSRRVRHKKVGVGAALADSSASTIPTPSLSAVPDGDRRAAHRLTSSAAELADLRSPMHEAAASPELSTASATFHAPQPSPMREPLPYEPGSSGPSRAGCYHRPERHVPASGTVSSNPYHDRHMPASLLDYESVYPPDAGVVRQMNKQPWPFMVDVCASEPAVPTSSELAAVIALAEVRAAEGGFIAIGHGAGETDAPNRVAGPSVETDDSTEAQPAAKVPRCRPKTPTPQGSDSSPTRFFNPDWTPPKESSEAFTPEKTEPTDAKGDADALSPTAWVTPDAPMSEPTAPSAPAAVDRAVTPVHSARRRKLGLGETAEDACRAEPIPNAQRFCFDYNLGRACRPECTHYGWRHACQRCARNCAHGEGRFECSQCAEPPPPEIARAEPSGVTSDEARLPSAAMIALPLEPEGETLAAPDRAKPTKGQPQDCESQRGVARPPAIDLTPYVRKEKAANRIPRYVTLSKNNLKAILNDKKGARCYYCFGSPSIGVEVATCDPPYYDTVVCPICGVDAVLPASEIPDEATLHAWHYLGFIANGNPPSDPSVEAPSEDSDRDSHAGEKAQRVSKLASAAMRCHRQGPRKHYIRSLSSAEYEFLMESGATYDEASVALDQNDGDVPSTVELLKNESNSPGVMRARAQRRKERASRVKAAPVESGPLCPVEWPSLAQLGDNPNFATNPPTSDVAKPPSANTQAVKPPQDQIQDGLAQGSLGIGLPPQPSPAGFAAGVLGSKTCSEISTAPTVVNPAAYVDARPMHISFHSDACGATVVVVAGHTIPVEQGANGMRLGQEVVVDASRSNAGTVTAARPMESVWDAPHWKTNKPPRAKTRYSRCLWRRPVDGPSPTSAGRADAKAAARGKAVTPASSDTATPQRPHGSAPAARGGAAATGTMKGASGPKDTFEEWAALRSAFEGSAKTDNMTNGVVDSKPPEAVVAKHAPQSSEVVTDGSGSSPGRGEVCGERASVEAPWRTLVPGLYATNFPSKFEAGPELEHLGRYAKVYRGGFSDPDGIEADPADLCRAGLTFKRDYCALIDHLLGRVPDNLYLEAGLKGIYFVGGLRVRGVSEKAIALPAAGLILIDLKWLDRELEATEGESRSKILVFKAGRVLHEIAHLCDYRADPQGWRCVDELMKPLLGDLQFPARGSGLLPNVTDCTRRLLPNHMLYAAMAPEEFKAEMLADLWLIGDLSAASVPQRLAWAYWRARSKAALPSLNNGALKWGFRVSSDAPDLPIWAQRALFAYKMGDHVQATPLYTARKELKDTLAYAEAVALVRQNQPPLGFDAQRGRKMNVCASEPRGPTEAPSEMADPPLWLAQMREELAEAENGAPSLETTLAEPSDLLQGLPTFDQFEAEMAACSEDSLLETDRAIEEARAEGASASPEGERRGPSGEASRSEGQREETRGRESDNTERVVTAAAMSRAGRALSTDTVEAEMRRGPMRPGKSKYASTNARDDHRPYAKGSGWAQRCISPERRSKSSERWWHLASRVERNHRRPPAALLDDLERRYAASLRRQPRDASSAEISIMFDIKGEHSGQRSRLWVDLSEPASVILYQVVLQSVGHVSRNMLGWRLVGGRGHVTFDTEYSGEKAGLRDRGRYSLVGRLRGGGDEQPSEEYPDAGQHQWADGESEAAQSPQPVHAPDGSEELPPTPIPVHRQPGENPLPAGSTPTAQAAAAAPANPVGEAAAEASEAGPVGAGAPAPQQPGTTSYSPFDTERLRQERRRAELEAAMRTEEARERQRFAEMEAERQAEEAQEQQRLAESEAAGESEQARERQRLADEEASRLADLALERRIENEVQARVQEEIESERREMEVKMEELVDLELRKRLSRMAAHARNRAEASNSNGSSEALNSGEEAAISPTAAPDPEELDVGPLDLAATRPGRPVDFGSSPHSQQTDRRPEEQPASHPPRPRSERAPGTEPRWQRFQGNGTEGRWDDGSAMPSRRAAARSPPPSSPPVSGHALGPGGPGPASTATTTARAARRGATGSTFSMPDDPDQADDDLSFWEQEESATFTDAPTESMLTRYCERHSVAKEVQELIQTVRRLPWQANTVSPHTNCFNPNLERPPLPQKQNSTKKLSDTRIAQKDFKFFTDPKLTASTELDQLHAWVKVRTEICITLRTCVDTRCSGAEFLPAIRDELNRLLGHTQALPQLAALIVQGLQTFVTLASNCLLLACDMHFCPEYSSLTALQTVRRKQGQSLVDLFAHVELLLLQSKNKEQEGRDYIYDTLRLTDRQAIPDLHRYTVQAVEGGDQPWAAEVAVALDRACTNARAYARTVNEKDRAAVLQLQAIAFNAGIIGLDQNLSLAYKSDGHRSATYGDYDREDAQYPPRQPRTRGTRARNTVAPVTTRSAGQPPRAPPQQLQLRPPQPPPPPPPPPAQLPPTHQQQFLKPLDHAGRFTERPVGHAQAEPRKGASNPGPNPDATTTNLWIDMAEARRAAEEQDSERKRLAVMIWPSDDCTRFAADVECKATPVFENDGRPAYFNDGRPMVSFNHKNACRFCSVWAARHLDEWKQWPQEVKDGQHNPKVCPRSIAALLKAGNPGASFLKERWGKKPTRPEGQRRPGQ